MEKIAERGDLSRKRRRRRYGLKPLLLVVALLAVCFYLYPFVAESVYGKYRVITDADFKEQMTAELRTRRPIASKYRDERLVWNDLYGYTLMGECLVNGKWRPYRVYGKPDTWPKYYYLDDQ